MHGIDGESSSTARRGIHSVVPCRFVWLSSRASPRPTRWLARTRVIRGRTYPGGSLPVPPLTCAPLGPGNQIPTEILVSFTLSLLSTDIHIFYTDVILSGKRPDSIEAPNSYWGSTTHHLLWVEGDATEAKGSCRVS
jgi:hypothetical protein